MEALGVAKYTAPAAMHIIIVGVVVVQRRYNTQCLVTCNNDLTVEHDHANSFSADSA